MATLLEDIKKYSSWTIKIFKSDGVELDYSMNSLIETKIFSIEPKKAW